MEEVNKLDYLNIGCGNVYHKDWVNIDLHSFSDHVISYDVANGLPYENNTFSAVYCSHFLEHLSREQASVFIGECYRVLKVKGTIRIVVPNLEDIIRSYLSELEKANNGDKQAVYNHEWMILEMFDQFSRIKSGGEMKKYLENDNLKNEKFIVDRCGDEIKKIRNNFKKKDYNQKNSKINFFKKVIIKIFGEKYKQYKIGQFRLGGEVHQWMYDSYSLNKLLKSTGFKNSQVMKADSSNIVDWNEYRLDVKDGIIYAPSSLYMEAIK